MKYWIYGDPEKDAQVLDVKTPYADLTNLYPYCDYEMRVCSYNTMSDGYDTDIVACQTLEDGNYWEFHKCCFWAGFLEIPATISD